MDVQKLRDIINSCVNDIVFDYNNKHCGITVLVDNSKPSFDMWYGDEIISTNDIEEIMNKKMFDNESISDLVNKGVEFRFV